MNFGETTSHRIVCDAFSFTLMEFIAEIVEKARKGMRPVGIEMGSVRPNISKSRFAGPEMSFSLTWKKDEDVRAFEAEQIDGKEIAVEERA